VTLLGGGEGKLPVSGLRLHLPSDQYLSVKPPPLFTSLTYPLIRELGQLVGMAIGLLLADPGIGVRVLIEARGSSLLHAVQVGCGVHQASYAMGTEVKTAGA
jgi:hypothetical protein